MIRSTDRIRTTHVGSLARPRPLLDLMKAAAEGHHVDPAELAETERRAVADVVARQRAAGLDMIGDGEQTKTGFFAYTGQRLSGFEPRPGRDPLETFRAEIDSFPGDPPGDCMGQVRGPGRGRTARHGRALARTASWLQAPA